MSRTWAAVLGGVFVLALVLYACVDSGPGSDFDDDGLGDRVEDLDDDFEYDAGETDFLSPDTDRDGQCDGRPESPLVICAACEDCNGDGSWEPCLNESDPLNDDTDNDGIPDDTDPQPLDRLTIDCGQGDVRLAYGASLPDGKPFPVRPTATPSPAPFPTSTPGPSPTPAFTPAGP